MKWGVFSGDRLIALAGDPAEAHGIIKQLAEENSGQDAGALIDRLYLKKTWQEAPLLTGEELRLAINDAVLSKDMGTAIVVNGKEVLAVKSREEAEQILLTLKSEYGYADGETRFAEDVELVDTMVDRGSIRSFDQAMEEIKKGSRETTEYQIKEGDTLWDIANNHGVSLERLMALNPGLNPDCMAIGKTIYLTTSDPLINVESVKTEVATEVIEPPVEERKDPSIIRGDRKVVAEGKEGKRQVTYQLTMRNGVEVSREILDETVLEEPETRVVATGTRYVLASRAGGGRLAWPKNGSISSPFGKRGGGMHTGIDITGSIGESVVAAESGTVTRAQWAAGYGKCIEISHGDGVVTRYAHLSSIGVSVGQKVSRGELIGRVGSTGNSTGPHLHFEVIVNGQARNPLNYL
ncbi:MAG: LysM peptidoglycan-binding domain-containing M23 family metallopeptidase [Bacillota bacterium]